MSIEICVREQTTGHSFESFLLDGQEDAIDGHVISGSSGTCLLATCEDCDAAGNVTHRDTVAVLLHLQLLELDELGPPGLEGQPAPGPVDPAPVSYTHLTLPTILRV